MMELDAESQPSNDHTVANTPTHTSNTIHGPGPKGNFSMEQYMESVPWPGRTFMIRNRASDQILARENGNLVLKGIAELAPCGWRWACVEHPEGWFGFRETSSGTYLGRDNQGGFRARATEHKGREQFDARRHPDGGYQLLSIHWWNRQRMAVDMKTQRVVEITGLGDTAEAAARWDFVQIE